jgi:membrane-associated phospholipid phosphatase
MMTYMLILLLLVNPYLFGVNSLSEQKSIKFILTVFFSTFLIPAFAIFMMWRLKLVNTLDMKDKQERIGPFIVTGVFYLWVYRSVLADSNIPTAFLIAALGTTMGLFICFLINLFFKISLHAAGVGGLLGMVMIVMWLYSYGSFTVHLPLIGEADISINFVLIGTILIAGVVCTARLLLKAHSQLELYAGFALGLLCQYAALKILV